MRHYAPLRRFLLIMMQLTRMNGLYDISVNIIIPQFLHAKTRSSDSAVCVTIRITAIGSTQVGHEGALLG
jgi:hypothetical protein